MIHTLSPAIEALPELLSSQHLVDLGLYSSIDAAYQARINGHTPAYIKLRHKILYPKTAVIEFLKNRMYSSHTTEARSTER